MPVPFSFLLAIPILLGIYLLSRGPSQSRWGMAGRVVGTFLLALPCGGLTYLFMGIEVARIRQVGHFYSVPFGGYAVSDRALALSLLAWTAVYFCIVALLIRAISSRKQQKTSQSNNLENGSG
jgi:ascorbate-specific PTS system EIIC-type component UlaA